ncbi:DUF4424 family protein [Allorhizobium sp. NPDC080224]|uniref:DUF4424 family protein n=1 Tax=Allorhizobium sp. NPDC080224 TaxID=3390547 RepID=UPI003D094B01
MTTVPKLMLACALQALATTTVLANDSMATLEAGGLVFTRSDEITMAKEDLYISPEQVEVKYLYRNTSDKPVSTIVAFPMPKIGGILTTGNNWYGPIGDFRLTVDKLNPESIVSFCGQGVKKTGPTTFEMRAKDFYPERDLNILLVVSNKVAMQAP